MAGDRLNPKRQRFVDEYVIDLNGSAAYRRAGYKVKSDDVAKAAAARLLADVNVAAAVRSALATRKDRAILDADAVDRELARIAFSDPRKLYRPDGTLKPPCEWDDDDAAAVASVETDETLVMGEGSTTVTTRTHRVKRWDKLSALDKAARRLQLYDDRERDGAPAPPVVFVTVNVNAAPSAPAPTPAIDAASVPRDVGGR